MVKGCGLKLAPGQHWMYCGETDMGQTAPALCTECGGDFVINNERRYVRKPSQVGGNHYQTETGFQHWDMVALFNLDYFQGQITKYVLRWRDKNGVEDLRKAQHFLQKYIELAEEREATTQGLKAGSGYVNQG